MTLVSDIIKNAYREGNLIAIGDSVSSEQSDEALDRLNVLVAGVYGNEAGDQFNLWPIPSEQTDFYSYGYGPQYPPPQSKLVCNLTGATTLYLPKAPSDGMRMGVLDIGQTFSTNPLTLDGQGYLIEGSPQLTLSTSGENREWLFRADLGSWQKYTPLIISDLFPFPPDFDDYFVTALAARLNPRYEKTTSPETVEALRRSRSQFIARYRQKTQVPPDIALSRIYPHHLQSGWNLSSDYFNKGILPWF